MQHGGTCEHSLPSSELWINGLPVYHHDEHCNVMPSITLRRSCVFAQRTINASRTRSLSASAKVQQSTAARTIEHKQNLERLQAIDQVHLQQVKDQLTTLTKSAQDARSHTESLFTDIQLLPESPSIPPYTLHALAPRKFKALAAADEMLKRAQVLRDHLEDLEREPYPELNPDVVVDKDWEGRVLRMNEQERKDALFDLESTMKAMRHSVDGGLKELEKRFVRAEDERNGVGMPLKGAGEGKKVEEVKKAGYGVGREDGGEAKTAEQKDEGRTVEEEQKPKKKGFGLGDLQRKLEERAKQMWKR